MIEFQKTVDSTLDGLMCVAVGSHTSCHERDEVASRTFCCLKAGVRVS